MGQCIIAKVRLALMLVSSMTFATAAAASPLDPSGQDWEGLSQFVALARAEIGTPRVVVTQHLDLATLGKDDALVLVHPERALEVEELTTFLKAGGRIVVIDDYGSGDELLSRFGIRRVPLPTRPAEVLRGNPAFAIAEPAGTHSVVRDVGRVVTNHATGLDHKALSPVLVVRGEGEPDVMLAVAGAVGRGRLLGVGDSSVVMNSMLRYPGNHALAAALVRYATEDDASGRHEGKLYVLVNDFETRGSYGTDGGVSGFLGDVWRTFDEVLETLRHDGMPPLAAYLFALAVGLGVVAWTSTRAGKPHKAVTPRYIRSTPTVAQGGVAGRAASLTAPGTRRVLAMLELKSALEEEVATRLGLDRSPAPEDLARRARAAGLLDAERAESMARLLKMLAELENALSLKPQRRWVIERVRDADVFSVASRVHDLLEAVAAPRP